jgi:hypothetical protein
MQQKAFLRFLIGKSEIKGSFYNVNIRCAKRAVTILDGASVALRRRDRRQPPERKLMVLFLHPSNPLNAAKLTSPSLLYFVRIRV